MVARAGIATTVVAAVLALMTIWLEINEDSFIKLILSFGCAAIALAHMSLLSLATLERKYEWLRAGAFLFAGLLAAGRNERQALVIQCCSDRSLKNVK